MLPKVPQFVNKSILQGFQVREDGIGQLFSQMAKDLLDRIEFGTVGRQVERMHVVRPDKLPTAMTPRTVQDDPNGAASQFVAQMV